MKVHNSPEDAIDSPFRQAHARADAPIQTVAIRDLLPAVDTPRLDGEDLEHVRTLASSDAILPPILVHRKSFRVIDGSHRLRAATLRGAKTIEVTFFEGSSEDAFVAAVQANTAHGLPLSLADRKAAAVRILGSHPHWSDRAIGEVAGLAARTVAALRRSNAEVKHLDRRIGKDGRVRPVSSAAGRIRAAEIIRDKPGASLREIAHAAGVSPMTARDVRERVERGDTLIPDKQTPPGKRTASRRSPRTNTEAMPDPMLILDRLRRDPSLFQTENGRLLLRRLDAQMRGLASFPTNSTQVPPHCLHTLAELAHAFSGRWEALAKELENHLEGL